MGWLCWGAEPSSPELVHASGIKATGTHDRAIVIAVDDYAFVPEVVGAEDNAKDWIRFLKSDLGITTVTSLLGAQATKEDILFKMEEISEEMSSEDRLWVVFIGHGAPSLDGRR